MGATPHGRSTQGSQDPGLVKCLKGPVCGMGVSYTTAVESLEYEGKTCYFCASTCRKAFEAEPGKYLRQHRQHGIK